jgi:hypothetical protein
MYPDETLEHEPEFYRAVLGLLGSVGNLVYVGWHLPVPLIDYYQDLFSTITVIEAWPKNAIAAKVAHPHVEVINRNLVDIRDKSVFRGAGVLWQQGPEHVWREEAVTTIRRWQSVAHWIILEAPNGIREQGECDDNPFESHISSWRMEDFEELGFRTVLFMDPNRTGSIIGYWHVDSHEELPGFRTK